MNINERLHIPLKVGPEHHSPIFIRFVLSVFQFKSIEIILFKSDEENEKKRQEFMTQHKAHITVIYQLKMREAKRMWYLAHKYKIK